MGERTIPFTPPTDDSSQCVPSSAQRRKMVRKSLAAWVDQAQWAHLAINPEARAETLSCADFAAIADLPLDQSDRAVV